MGEQDDGQRQQHGNPPEPQSRDRRQRLLVLGLGAAALVAAVAVGISTATAGPAGPVAAATTTPSTLSTAPTSSAAPETKASTSVATPAASTDPQALAGLQAVAATVTTPVRLTSPTAWDQWLPEGKPFPGASTEEEMSTCPRLASRLTAALGQKMSYWSGTLPGGPYGCQWVPVPLEYDSPDYDYVISVGFLADGTTPRSLAEGYATAGGPCPWIELPAAAPGALLIGCTTGTSSEYTLALPDSRLSGGLWTLVVVVKDRAAVPAPEVLPVLVEGAVAAFG
jgi:hypothetical protein